MILDNVNFTNPDYGYESIIELPLHFSELGNGKISTYDETYIYDKYSCKCNCIFDAYEIGMLSYIYTTTDRGLLLSLTDTISSGFYPFTPLILNAQGNDPGKYDVYLQGVKNKGAIDVRGKAFKAEFNLLLSYDTNLTYQTIQTAASEGSLSIGDSALEVTGIRFPNGGFDIDLEYNVFPSQTLGGTVFGTIYSAASEKKETTMSILCNEKTCSNILYRLIFNYRGQAFKVSTGDQYFMFGQADGDNRMYSVKLSTNKISVKHVGFNEFEIKLSVVKIADILS